MRYRSTDYSVPTAYGHREVLIRGYVNEVVISCGAETVARHPRSYKREDFVYTKEMLLEKYPGEADEPYVGVYQKREKELLGK